MLKLCVDCKAYVPIENFKRAHVDFPTRDGFNHCCNKHEFTQWRRLPNGRVEIDEGRVSTEDV